MSLRPMLSGVTLVSLLLLLVAGCANKVSVSPDVSETEAMLPDSAPEESEEELAARRERELQAAIDERERRVVEDSMRRRFGEPASTTPAMGISRQDFVDQNVHFAYDSFTLSAEARAILEQKAAWLAENSAITVQIEGHCDERGTTAYNLALGERRAHSVQQYLTALGIEASRVLTISYGEEYPLDPGHNEAAWARNRRAHFVINGQGVIGTN